MNRLEVYVGNLSLNTDKDKLKEVFASVGEIKNSRVATHKDGASKGFGFVTFNDEETAEKAVNEMNGKEIDGSIVVVQISRPQDRKRRDHYRSSYRHSYHGRSYDRSRSRSSRRRSRSRSSRRRYRSRSNRRHNRSRSRSSRRRYNRSRSVSSYSKSRRDKSSGGRSGSSSPKRSERKSFRVNDSSLPSKNEIPKGSDDK
ncbi:hypothetical protein ENUP19_0055G0079 [Entamoeba nuttalli]|uniref:RNA recognition motif (RRM, RBD, or RNP domain) containing protein n=2 Tax=Entamoeba nuttalli TaxID=412467 RepID=K2GWI1_ENTNP|nr:RNA recognition motif (RRM, RBD, or RNP domain) containing protein [Entamoeba nuttalli P19]EKE39578.1 RNA recognition motif (RRM, RBD, or RNP domain) containing protein [Entamoeba nuttalli P19]|eukprot:XP_008858088.1 RNA recognition motif (RRM, RBD, or RNP domain) containing protein [Entamoeba nuttalli P19]